MGSLVTADHITAIWSLGYRYYGKVLVQALVNEKKKTFRPGHFCPKVVQEVPIVVMNLPQSSMSDIKTV